jgi:uncharacterized membrane protein
VRSDSPDILLVFERYGIRLKRYAKGEITKEDFDRMKKDIL